MENVKKFVKEHKLLLGACIVAIVLVIALLIIFVPRGNSLTDEDYLSGIGTAPDSDNNSESSDDKTGADEFPNGDSEDSKTTVNPDEDDKDSEDDSTTPADPDDGDDKSDSSTEPDDKDDSSDDTTEPTNPDDKEPAHTCSYTTLKSDSSNHWYVCSCGKTANKSAHNYSDDSDTTCNTCGYTREVTTEEPTPSNPTFSSAVWDNGTISLGSLGINIPVLREFNSAALEGHSDEGCTWAGQDGLGNLTTLSNTLDNVAYKLIDCHVLNAKTGQGFALENYSISFDWASYSSNHDLQLKRDPDSGVYTLIINCALDEDIFGIYDLAPYSRDVLLTMLTTVSSTPNELYSYIYRGLYEDSSILYSKSFASVGDCKVRWNTDSSWISDSGSFSMVFEIKSK